MNHHLFWEVPSPKPPVNWHTINHISSTNKDKENKEHYKIIFRQLYQRHWSGERDTPRHLHLGQLKLRPSQCWSPALTTWSGHGRRCLVSLSSGGAGAGESSGVARSQPHLGTCHQHHPYTGQVCNISNTYRAWLYIKKALLVFGSKLMFVFVPGMPRVRVRSTRWPTGSCIGDQECQDSRSTETAWGEM